VGSGDDDEDRKRLKERLKGAINSDLRRRDAKGWNAAEGSGLAGERVWNMSP